MRDHMISHEVKEVALPKIGCGLDKLSWKKVRDVIVKVFTNTDIQIYVYELHKISASLNNLFRKLQ
jgi:O-acetyl-ADP-ribose deacetylase (regulator of RNase III)